MAKRPRTTPQQAIERRKQRIEDQIKFFDEQLMRGVTMTARSRLRLAAMILRDRVVVNISRPVVKVRGKRSRRIQVDPRSRSKPGEFPHAETTRLMKSIFYQVEGNRAIVGTPLGYGLILEVKRQRSFLVRTLNEMIPTLRRIMAAQ